MSLFTGGNSVLRRRYAPGYHSVKKVNPANFGLAGLSRGRFPGGSDVGAASDRAGAPQWRLRAMESARFASVGAAIFATALTLVECTTTLTPEGEHVRVTKDKADVAACKSVGFVDAQPPYSTPNDAMNEMKNKTAILGGNVLFVTNYGMKATGVAYLCGVDSPPKS